MGGGDTSVLRGEPAAAAASATMGATRGAVSDLTGKGEVDAATPAAAFDRHFETMFNAFNAANEEDDQLEDEDGASEQDAVEAAAAAASSSALSAAASSERDRCESDEEDGKDDNWFYTDDDDEALLHGPYSAADLQEWATDGHFALTDLVRKGRNGTPVELSSVLLLHAASM